MGAIERITELVNKLIVKLNNLWDSIGDGQLTLKQGNTPLGTFKANQKNNTTITIPTNTTYQAGTVGNVDASNTTNRVWSGKVLNDLLGRIKAITEVNTSTFDARNLIKNSYQATLLVTATGSVSIDFPEADEFEGVKAKIVSSRSGGLVGVSISKSYIDFSGSTVAGSMQTKTYVEFQSDGTNWRLIGGN